MIFVCVLKNVGSNMHVVTPRFVRRIKNLILQRILYRLNNFVYEAAFFYIMKIFFYLVFTVNHSLIMLKFDFFWWFVIGTWRVQAKHDKMSRVNKN